MNPLITLVKTVRGIVKLRGGTDNTVVGNVADSIKVNVTNSFAAGVADKTTFTYGTSIVSAVGGAYQDTSPSLTAGQQGVARLTQNRAIHLNLRNDSGTEIGTTANPVSVDITGRKLAYSSFASFNPAVTPTDVFTLTGSATKTVRVTRVQISGSNTGNTNAFFQFIKRSAANTGGTTVNLSEVPYDSTNAAATSVAVNYTVNPAALGTAVGTLTGGLIFLSALASTNSFTDKEIIFGSNSTQGIVLRGTSEIFAINFNGVNLGILSATVLNISVEWTEES